MTTATPPAAPTTRRPRRLAVTARPAGDDWLTQGACRETDPELFFPVGRSIQALAQAEAAKAVCMRCPVRAECLKWAIRTGQTTGVWGGMSEHERWEIGARPVTRRSADGRQIQRPQFDRCVDAKEFIEAKVAAGASIRSIARELGVGHDSVRRAREFYLAEDAATGAVKAA